MVKISKIIITLAIILLLLGVIAIAFPQDGITIGSVKLEFPSLKEIFFDSDPQYADIESIVAKDLETDGQNEQTEDTDTEEDDGIVGIELPEDNPGYLYSFFESLDSISKFKNKVRIIHYGDSQIEGDRITSYIRQKFQDQFSGSGQGEIPLYSLSNISNVTFEYSKGVKFHTILDKAKSPFKNYGLMQSAVIMQSDNSVTLHFFKSVSTPMTLYFKAESGELQVIDGDSVLNNFVCSDNMAQNSDDSTNMRIESLTIKPDKPLKTLNIRTNGNFELYSLDFSEKSGVYVDNVSLRGSSGFGFNRNSEQILNTMGKQLGVKLIILQFGINAVPQDDSQVMTSYHFYKVQMSRQIAFLKRSNPQAAIIVIGLSDRSVKKGNGYQTNPNVPKILQAQNEAAKENGVAFWNLFEAMGGENSMPSWVLRDKPLANTDFIHFNSAGANYVGDLFYNAITKSYQKYLKKKKH